VVVVGTAAKREGQGKDAERNDNAHISNPIVAHHLWLRRMANDEHRYLNGSV
jgi:hypothetical protein